MLYAFTMCVYHRLFAIFASSLNTQSDSWDREKKKQREYTMKFQGYYITPFSSMCVGLCVICVLYIIRFFHLFLLHRSIFAQITID